MSALPVQLENTDAILASVEEALAKGAKDGLREFALDTETPPEVDRPWELQPLGVSIANDYGQWWLPLTALGDKPALDVNKVRDFLKQYLLDPTWTVIAQNSPFDLNVLYSFGIDVKAKVLDTMQECFLINEEKGHMGRLGLKDQAFDEFGAIMPTYYQSELAGGTVSADEYAALDAKYTWLLHKLYVARIEKLGLTKYLRELASEIFPIVAKMMRLGIQLDLVYLKKLEEHLEDVKTCTLTKLQKIAPDVNPASPKKLSEYLFNVKKLKPHSEKGPAGYYSTDYSELLYHRGDAYVDALLMYRDVEKSLGTYVKPLCIMATADPHNRIHTHLALAFAVTGRFSSSAPNCQNISRDEEGNEWSLRKLFCAKSGYVLAVCDFNQLELRIMAHQSRDPKMVEAYKKGLDIHKITQEKCKCARPIAKQSNFSIQYLGSAFTLQQILWNSAAITISLTGAKKIVSDWKSTYSGVVRYWNRIRTELDRKGYVRSLLGRYRRIRVMSRKEDTPDGYGHRQAVNSTIQSSAADFILLAMRNFERIKKSKMLTDSRWANVEQLLQVHDELVVETPVEIAEEVKKTLEDVFATCVTLIVPISGSCGIGKNWSEAKH